MNMSHALCDAHLAVNNVGSVIEFDEVFFMKDYLIESAKKLHINLNDKKCEQLIKYYEMLIEWNNKINLTAITDYKDVVIKHFIDSLSIVNILYICRKQNLEALKLSLMGLSQYIEIVDLPSCMVLKGLRSNWDDYEDFLQHETAIANNCNCILTRNIEDFSKSSLPIYSPEDFMKLIV